MKDSKRTTMESIFIGPCDCGGYGQVFDTASRLKIGVCHREANSLLGVFVTAKLKDKDDCRQGWVTSIDPLVIRGESGNDYKCEGKPSVVVNPPC